MLSWIQNRRVTNFDNMDQWNSCSIDELQYYYLNGYCAILAVVMNQKLGWPIVAVTNGEDYIWHYAVQNPENELFADARGLNLPASRLTHIYLIHSPKEPELIFVDKVDPDYIKNRPRNFDFCMKYDLPRFFPDLKI